MTDWIKLRRWPNIHFHKRNIDIAIKVAEGNTQRFVGELYGLSGNRINQIFRIISAHCADIIWKIPFHEGVYDKNVYRNKRMLNLLNQYKSFYLRNIDIEKSVEV